MFKLIESFLPFQFIFMKIAFINVEITIVGYIEIYSNSGNQRNSMGLFLERSIVDSESPNGVDVY